MFLLPLNHFISQLVHELVKRFMTLCVKVWLCAANVSEECIDNFHSFNCVIHSFCPITCANLPFKLEIILHLLIVLINPATIVMVHLCT